jgi:hypothetical protein
MNDVMYFVVDWLFFLKDEWFWVSFFGAHLCYFVVSVLELKRMKSKYLITMNGNPHFCFENFTLYMCIQKMIFLIFIVFVNFANFK